MTQKKLQKKSVFNEYDEDGDGVVSDEELSHVKEIKETESKLRKQIAQLRMARYTLIGMGVFTAAMFFMRTEKINALSDIIRGEGIKENNFTEFFEQKSKDLQGITGTDAKNLGIAGGGLFATTVAKAAGINIGADEFLARSGGRILNPNAELLFQGPVLRDFAFKFLMVARSKKEGEMIRKIIRWFKTGAAPVFNDRALLQTPSIFQLTYGRGQGSSDYFLPTVNKFNEMALRNITVDYAPDGFWSAYQDSQPVAVVVNLQFTELRPVYKQDQEYAEAQNETSVGY